MNMNDTNRTVVLTDYAHLSLHQVIVAASLEAGVSNQQLLDIYPPKRWAAIVSVLTGNKIEVWVMLAFMYARHQNSIGFFSNNYRDFCNKFQSDLSDTSEQNISTRFHALMRKVYEQEKFLTDNSPIVISQEERKKDLMKF